MSEAYHDHPVPPSRLTTAHPCLDVFALRRDGLLIEGATRIVKTTDGGCLRLAVNGGKLWLGEQAVGLDWHPVAQRVFTCPACNCLRYKLFQVNNRWACYRCHGLTHASRHVSRMLPRWHRLMLLRRRIGASLVPFSPIEPKPVRHRRYWRDAAEIRKIEAGLVGHIRVDVADVLERRDARS